MPEGLGYVFGLDTDKADVAGADSKIIMTFGIVYLDLEAVECQKFIIRQLIVGDKNIVISISNDRIA